MPKILIKENDLTSPGLPDSYSNFSVLITGYKNKNVQIAEGVHTVEADHNGVYSFTSAQDFKNTIGLVASDGIDYSDKEASRDAKTLVPNYGNQMAYELLNLGYPILYKAIDADNLIALKEDKPNENFIGGETFWKPFRDKATYDFRFITHGFLRSNEQDVVDYYALIDANISAVEQAKNELTALDNVTSAELETFETELNGLLDASGQQYIIALDKNNPSNLDNYKNFRYTGEFYFIGEENTEGIASIMTEPPIGIENIYTPIVEQYLQGLYRFDARGQADKTEGIYEDFSAALTGTAKELEKLESISSAKDASSLTDDSFNQINGCIAKLATYVNPEASLKVSSNIELAGRGDCIALIELNENAYNASITPEIAIVEAINSNFSFIDDQTGPYCALTVPSVTYNMSVASAFNNNKKFPGAFHYLACFINSLKQGFAEWYAAAGYSRGISSFTVDKATVKLGEIAINTLEPRYLSASGGTAEPRFACNVIANFRNNYYLWGNRTAYPLGFEGDLEKGDLTASSFLNIRQLCTSIKKQLYVSCRRFTFDPNSDLLWHNFTNAIRPTLEAMKADQGIRDYRILKVATDKKATLKAKIRIIPIEAIEDFDLEVSLEDSFGETTAVVTE